MSTDQHTSVNAIDIREAALSINAGTPVLVQLADEAVYLRRDFTGQDVHEYITIFSEAGPQEIREQITQQLEILLAIDTEDETREKLVEYLMGLPLVETTAILIKLGQVAGLRGADTGFLTGVTPSSIR